MANLLLLHCTVPLHPLPQMQGGIQRAQAVIGAGWRALTRCIRREGTREVASEAARQAVGGGCQSGWGRLPSATNAVEAGHLPSGRHSWA